MRPFDADIKQTVIDYFSDRKIHVPGEKVEVNSSDGTVTLSIPRTAVTGELMKLGIEMGEAFGCRPGVDLQIQPFPTSYTISFTPSLMKSVKGGRGLAGCALVASLIVLLLGTLVNLYMWLSK